MRERSAAVVVDGLVKRYGAGWKCALDCFDLKVGPVTLLGLLGPNGVGKTTEVRIFATLLRFEGGRAEVAGHDDARQPQEVRASIGVAGQHAALDEVLSGHWNRTMFGRLYHLARRTAAANRGWGTAPFCCSRSDQP